MKAVALWFLNRALSLFLGELWLFLKDTVATYEQIYLSPAQKRLMVYDSVMIHAQKAGLDISASLLNLGIEAALQTVRGKTGE